MADVKYLTEEGAAELRRELEQLKTVKRAEVAAKLKEAIAQGDLSENADYQDAKEQQAFLEGRINYLEDLLRNAVIISNADKKAAGVIGLGSEVTVQEEGEAPETFVIVGAAEANPREGKISNESPLGRALLGHKAGEKVAVETPSGVLIFKIKSVKASK
ncbi:MAG: transcription elongation factor GreA [Candidatus Thermofonsia Clade 1 bacterium]|jgi:transcription elongation factor GreA|uniref:Transcription elongation factor GreA n=1 Tax=Candidatus Thermofonsia Clade 1 bacterium TaxID=2364210 RepID=A0A2M8PHW5_9CHLR|nr:MAG: transcription elongation factor GreA [Candidatus Thermofonsia Clade 1 bacterium]RMF54057.1 MAG: transcription elongation factor GreA [Chloroflexota bacterium]